MVDGNTDLWQHIATFPTFGHRAHEKEQPRLPTTTSFLPLEFHDLFSPGFSTHRGLRSRGLTTLFGLGPLKYFIPIHRG